MPTAPCTGPRPKGRTALSSAINRWISQPRKEKSDGGVQYDQRGDRLFRDSLLSEVLSMSTKSAMTQVAPGQEPSRSPSKGTGATGQTFAHLRSSYIQLQALVSVVL